LTRSIFFFFYILLSYQVQKYVTANPAPMLFELYTILQHLSTGKPDSKSRDWKKNRGSRPDKLNQ